jgi:hypothetical protein
VVHVASDRSVRVPHASRRPSVILPFSLLVLFALALRLYGLDRYSLWLDELITYTGATAPNWYVYDHLHPQELFLYQLLSRLVSTIYHFFGKNDTIRNLRLLSVFFGILNVMSIFLLARELFSRSTPWIAGVSAAMCPVLILYSQEYRTYSLLAFLASFDCWVLLVALRTNALTWWSAFTGTSLLSLYSHPISVIPMAALSIFVIVWLFSGALGARSHRMTEIWRSIKIRGLPIFSAFGVIGIGSIPIIPFFIRLLAIDPSTSSGKLPLRFSTLEKVFGIFMGFGDGWRFWALFFLSLVGLAWLITRRDRGSIFAVIYLGLPICLFTFRGGADRLMSQPEFSSRYLIFLFPFYI